MIVGVEIEEELVDLVEDLVGSRLGSIHLVDHGHDGETSFERLGEHVTGLRHGTLRGIDQQQDAVDQGEGPLHLAPEVRVTRCVDEVDACALPDDAGGFGEDRDASLPFLIVRVHDPIDCGLVAGEDAGGAQHGVDEGRLAVVDVRDQRDVAERGAGHGGADVTGGRGPGRRRG